MGAIQDLFRAHGPAYLARFAARMPAEHQQGDRGDHRLRQPSQRFALVRL